MSAAIAYKQITSIPKLTNAKEIGTNTTTPVQDPYWNDPVVDNSTGAVQFQFGITYQNFPVTWVNVTGGGHTTVPMNISYDYVYDLDPVNGLAKLSPTITYGSLDANPNVKAAVSGLSLATIYLNHLYLNHLNPVT